MGGKLTIAFFGSSLVSSYWNGAATYYRGIIKALYERGHRVTFFEPDAYDRQAHRDMTDPEWATVVVYPATAEGVFGSLERAAGADLVVKASGVGVFDDLLEREVLTLKREATQVVFWDVDAPATLDREERVEEFFLSVAHRFPKRKFLFAGNGWGDKPRSANVSWIGHLGTNDHNAFNSSATAVLNISRASMASNGFSPATRVFEAAGAGACLITDAWEGIDHFFEPGKELLVARSGEEVASILDWLTPRQAATIGMKAFFRVRQEHTYRHRARRFEEVFSAGDSDGIKVAAGGGR